MKRLITLLALFILSAVTNAQETLAVRQGSRLQYSISVNGRTFPVFIQVDTLSATNFTMAWKYEDGRMGRFIMKKSSLDSAVLGYWNPPVSGEELELPATQNVLFLSRLIFSTLQKNKKAEFDEYTVAVKPSIGANAFKLKDKVIDALYLESEPGTKLWVLNNPATPLILKIEGNPFGVEAQLTGIE